MVIATQKRKEIREDTTQAIITSIEAWLNTSTLSTGDSSSVVLILRKVQEGIKIFSKRTDECAHAINRPTVKESTYSDDTEFAPLLY